MHPRNRQRKNASAMKLVGALVARFRRAADLTQRQLAEQACAQPETIASIEQGRRALLPPLARVLDVLLETKGALETAVENMPEIDLIPAWAEEYMDLERTALALSFFANQVLPGLLQTESYARAVFNSRVPAFSPEEIDTHVSNRLERQEILHRKNPPTTSFIISEAIVRMPLGGAELHRETLRHLRACADIPGFALQIMPLDRPTHAALDGPFILLETPDYQRLAYTETQRGSQLISDPDEVSILGQRYAMLRTQALNVEDTKRLLDQLLGEL
ncbi:helix-turn-helix protein [Streptomyces sp. 840.1]|uniref:helix-turn-helix domain-containing protein n=1 Tax=Streptomyces sp. 840.1 TaxID=2485152 RepID=UPI000F46AE17|nr:helix-turn-helix transcriptional regulator [Streptomyces sp. 840.1]ROQ68122.1 helix-turn-helix protein [Streptomyces sp. 840.1]